MSEIVPTVGRKVWYFKSPAQVDPWDATVIGVCGDAPDAAVSLFVISPTGNTFTVHGLTVGDGGSAGQHYRWMPYQKEQAARAEAVKPAELSVDPPPQVERVAEVLSELNGVKKGKK
jgi:hypothetical protein